MRHPWHALWVHFPIACWSLASIADLLAFTSSGLHNQLPNPRLLIICGLAFALPAIFLGLIDFVRMEAPHIALSTAYRHIGCMLGASGLYGFSLLARVAMPNSPIGFALSMAGLLLLTAGGWYGGKLVYRFGIGVSKF